MKLILVDLQKALCDAWAKHFEGLPDVEIVHGRFENIPEYDCMVSAANSFGLMDGGVDLAITNYFGTQLMERIQRRIIDEYFGEQPVGTSMIVETYHSKYPFLAHTPTMRVPMTIAHTDNVYLAMGAMLREVHHHNQSSNKKINIIACPGLGTLTGQVHLGQAARQMALAYKNYLNPPKSIDWQYAGNRQSEVRFGGDDGFRYPADWV